MIIKKDVMNMKKPSDATKLVLKKSRKYIVFRGLCSLIYRGIAMITPILFSNAVNLITAGKYKSAVIMSIIAIFTVSTIQGWLNVIATKPILCHIHLDITKVHFNILLLWFSRGAFVLHITAI